MRVDGIGTPNTKDEQVRSFMPADSKSKEYQDQIAEKQAKLKDLVSDQRLNEEEKEQERKELTQQIAELNQKLRMHQMELRREQQEKKSEPAQEEEQKDTRLAEIKDIGRVTHTGMNAVISANVEMNHAKAQGGMATSMEGRVRVLQNEIRQDEYRGEDTADKEAELEKLQEKATKLKSAKMNLMTGMLKDMKQSTQEETKVGGKPSRKASSIAEDPVAAAVGFAARQKTEAYRRGQMFSNVEFHF